MADYIPSPRQWVRDQVELYERSGGKEGTTLRDTGLPVIIVTHRGNKTGATRNMLKRQKHPMLFMCLPNHLYLPGTPMMHMGWLSDEWNLLRTK